MAGAGAIQFARTIGTDRVFSSASQDCSNKYATAELLYGVAQANSDPRSRTHRAAPGDRFEPAGEQVVVPERPRSGEGAAAPSATGAAGSCSSTPSHRARDRRDAPAPARHRPVPPRRDAPRDRPHRGFRLGRARRRRRERRRGARVRRAVLPRGGRADRRARRRSRSSSSRTRSPAPTARRSTCRPVSTWGGRDRWPTGSPRCCVLLTGNLDRPGGNYFAGAQRSRSPPRPWIAPRRRSCRPSGARTGRPWA